MAVTPFSWLFAGCSCCCNPATWRTRGSKAHEENAGTWNKWRGPGRASSHGWGGGRLCRESPHFVLASREGSALRNPPRQRRKKRVSDRNPQGPKPLAGSVHESAAPKADAIRITRGQFKPQPALIGAGADRIGDLFDRFDNALLKGTIHYPRNGWVSHIDEVVAVRGDLN